jgi:hypothetical protein
VPDGENQIPQSIPLELDKPKLLIGEGKDEVQTFSALLTYLRITDVNVEDYGGKNKLPGYLDVLRLRPGFAGLQSLGVTRDADIDSLGAFASISNYLRQREFVAPASSGIVAAGTPRVGIIILPGGQEPGMLENLVLEALRQDRVTDCIDRYFECIEAAKGREQKQISKARVQAWLAAQDPPDMRLGIAAQKGLIPWDHPSFEQLRNFLSAL